MNLGGKPLSSCLAQNLAHSEDKRDVCGAGRMAQHVKVPLSKPDGRGSNSRTHMEEGEN